MAAERLARLSVLLVLRSSVCGEFSTRQVVERIEIMRHAAIWGAVGLLLLPLVGDSRPAAGQDAAKLPPRYYALLVGVRQYDPNELRSLPYAEPDVEELSQLLTEQGFRRVVLMTQTVGAKQFRLLPTSRDRKSVG